MSLLSLLSLSYRAGAVAVLVLGAGCRPDVATAPAVDVRSYGAAIRVDPGTLHVNGRVRIAVRGAGGIELMLGESMAVRSVLVQGRAAEFERLDEALRVVLPDAASEYIVEVAYAGVPETGLYAGRAAGQRVIFTDAWPQRGAGWLPAVHHPSDPASFALAVEAPAPWEVVASGTPGRTTTLPDGHRRWHFTLDGDAPAYTFAFAAADFTALEDGSGSVPVRHYLLAADSARSSGLERVAPALDTLAALLGPYPYRSFATVEVPLGYDGMENAATPFLRAALYQGTGRALEEVAFHEAVHQWLGNRMVPVDWRDLWLSEGAATYLTTVLYERLEGPDAARRRRAVMSDLTSDDARRPLHPGLLERPADALNATVYGKGGAVYHLLRLKVGDEVFFRALRDLSTRARPASTTDLRRALEAGGADLGPFFAYWVYGGRVPRLRTHWNADRRVVRWRVEGAAGMLDGLPVELRLHQHGVERFVPLTRGSASLPGAGAPTVQPVGVVMRVED